MDAAAEPSQRVTLLQFRRVVPSSAWLRASILWADDLAAIWPMREPEPLDRAQEQPLQEVWSLLNAGYFERKYLSELLDPDENFARMLDDAGAIAPPLRGNGWEDGSLGAGPTLDPSAAQTRHDYDADTFIYPDKLPHNIIRELVRRRLINVRPDGGGYTAANREVLDQLLAVYASVLQERSIGGLLPDVEEPDQARRIAAPNRAGNTRQALVLAIRGAARPDLQTDFQRFIDFRESDKNERARRDYIEHLVGLWDLCARGGPEHAREQVYRCVMADVVQARESYFKLVTLKALAVQSLTVFGVVLPLAAGRPAPAVAGAVASVGASIATVSVRNTAPRYLRRAIKSELVAPTLR
jgi:hypothetical protein